MLQEKELVKKAVFDVVAADLGGVGGSWGLT